LALVIGVDSSTTATKVELRDADSGRLVGRARRGHPEVSPPRSEQDPESWWAALFGAISELSSANEAAAISVAAQQHGLVAMDASGRPIRPAKLWNDTESAPDSDALVAKMGPEWWAKSVGSVPVPAFTVTKLAWLKRCEPESFARMTQIGLPHDWLTLRLAGRLVTDRGDASGTGYWSPAEERWRTDVLDLIEERPEWPDCLPRVLGPSEPAGEVGSRAGEIGLSPSALVGPGTGDNMAAALGIGLRPGSACVSFGTSGTVYAVSNAPSEDPSGAVAGFADANGAYLPLVCTLNAMRVPDYFRRLLGRSQPEFDAMAARAARGSSGVVVVPYLDGERTPNLPRATASVFGIRAETSPEDIAGAVVEGVVCGLLDGLDALMNVGVEITGDLYVVGGGSHWESFRQALADLSQRRVIQVAEDELVARGACVQAAAVLHGCRPDEICSAWGIEVRSIAEPRCDATTAQEIRRRYQDVSRRGLDR
jgi:xylulokinase